MNEPKNTLFLEKLIYKIIYLKKMW